MVVNWKQFEFLYTIVHLSIVHNLIIESSVILSQLIVVFYINCCNFIYFSNFLHFLKTFNGVLCASMFLLSTHFYFNLNCIAFLHYFPSDFFIFFYYLHITLTFSRFLINYIFQFNLLGFPESSFNFLL